MVSLRGDDAEFGSDGRIVVFGFLPCKRDLHIVAALIDDLSSIDFGPVGIDAAVELVAHMLYIENVGITAQQVSILIWSGVMAVPW